VKLWGTYCCRYTGQDGREAVGYVMFVVTQSRTVVKLWGTYCCRYTVQDGRREAVGYVMLSLHKPGQSS